MKTQTPFEKFVEGIQMTNDEVLQAMKDLGAASKASGALGMPFFSVSQSAAHSWSILRVIADARGLTYEPF